MSLKWSLPVILFDESGLYVCHEPLLTQLNLFDCLIVRLMQRKKS
jgi:hypothetical protein